MTSNVESLILEHLRAIRSDIAGMISKIDLLTLRVSSLEEHVAGFRRDLALIHGDIATLHRQMDTHEIRLARIEHRLELAG